MHETLKAVLNSLYLNANMVIIKQDTHSDCIQTITNGNTLLRLNGFLQFCWQVRRCVILAFDDLIAFIQSLENSEGVANAVEGSKVFGQQFSRWWSGGTAYQSCQLLHQLLLLLLYIHLPFKHTTKSQTASNAIHSRKKAML